MKDFFFAAGAVVVGVFIAWGIKTLGYSYNVPVVRDLSA